MLNKRQKYLLESMQASPEIPLPLKQLSRLFGPRRWDDANVLGAMGLVRWNNRAMLELTKAGKSFRAIGPSNA